MHDGPAAFAARPDDDLLWPLLADASWVGLSEDGGCVAWIDGDHLAVLDVASGESGVLAEVEPQVGFHAVWLR